MNQRPDLAKIRRKLKPIKVKQRLKPSVEETIDMCDALRAFWVMQMYEERKKYPDSRELYDGIYEFFDGCPEYVKHLDRAIGAFSSHLDCPEIEGF